MIALILLRGAMVPLADGSFSELEHDEALATASADGRLAIIDFTATWCSPCKQMDATTWADPAVQKWIGEHAVAIQVDVDAEGAVARSYSVQAMPTIVVVRGEAEVDRLVGYRDSDDLLAWLDGILAGRTKEDRQRAEEERMREELDRMREVEETDVQGRYELAGELMRRGRDDEASGHYQWLWENALSHNPSYSGVRVSFMSSDIAELAARHEPTRRAFSAFFDRDRETLGDGWGDRDTLRDWIELGKITQREDEVIAWTLERCAEEEMPLKPYSWKIYPLSVVLLEHDLLAEAGRMFPDLRAAARARAERWLPDGDIFPPVGDDPGERTRRDMMREMMANSGRKDLLRYHRMAYLADRADQAQGVEQALIEAFDDVPMRLALVRQALDADAATPRHVRLAAEAHAAAEDEVDLMLAEDLLDRLEIALDREG